MKGNYFKGSLETSDTYCTQEILRNSCASGDGAKANVLHCVGFERWDAALLILQKRWHSVFHFSVRFLSVVSSFRVRHNVSQLHAGGDF